jgi:protein-disulfide isomerase
LPLLKQVLEQYPNDVKLVFKNFPLRNHRFARKAAAAALAAERQGKFWEYHDALFNHYNALNDAKFAELAQGLGLNAEQFEKDLKDPKIQARINQDIQDGQEAGVRGTPTIFVNGKRLKTRSLPGFSAMIEKERTKNAQ